MSRVSRRDAKGMAVLRWVEVTYSSYCIQGQRSAAVAFWLEHAVQPCRQRRKGAPVADMVLELTALPLACNSAPVLSAEMDPVTGRPALTVSLDLKVRMDVVALVEILASIANSQVEGGEEEEQTADAGQEEEEEEGREETEEADDAALLTGKPRIRAEETAPMPVSCSEDKILLA